MVAITDTERPKNPVGALTIGLNAEFFFPPHSGHQIKRLRPTFVRKSLRAHMNSPWLAELCAARPEHDEVAFIKRAASG